jgi:hypothetical protein
MQDAPPGSGTSARRFGKQRRGVLGFGATDQGLDALPSATTAGLLL